MKKKSLIAVAILFLIAVVVAQIFPASATAPDTPYEWCTQPNNDHKFPVLMNGLDFYKEYDVICGAETSEKVVYLTFDAGYDNGTHSTILDILKKADVPATFFFDGNMIKQNPETVKRAIADGHIVANHTLNHPDMTEYRDNKDGYFKQIEGWNEIYREITGLEPIKLMRFPMGKFSVRALDYNKSLGYTSVFWSLAYYDYDDYDQPTPNEAISKICSRVHPGAVILLHSTSKTNSLILDEVIDNLKADGYRFGVLTELMI